MKTLSKVLTYLAALLAGGALGALVAGSSEGIPLGAGGALSAVAAFALDRLSSRGDARCSHGAAGVRPGVAHAYAAASAGALVRDGGEVWVLAPSGARVVEATGIVRDNPDLFVNRIVDGVTYVVPA
jgi:hypothetical protein